MAKTSSLAAEPRERAGKGAARATRREGRVPGVIYGGNEEPVLLSVNPIELMKHMHAPGFFSQVLDIAVGKDSHKVLARDVQFHPVKDTALHIDFLRVTKKSVVTVEVEVVFENEEQCPGLKHGGVLNIVRHTVEVNCPAFDIPDTLIADLTGLEIGDSIHISSIKLPESCEPTITDRDFTIATVAAPTVMKAEDDEDENAESGDAEDGDDAEEGEEEGGED